MCTVRPIQMLSIDIASVEHFEFGPFRLYPARHLLVDEKTAIPLGSRAFTILTALLERAGELVSKDALIQRAWPDTIVEGGNLKLHVAAIRRALGGSQDEHHRIVNLPGRGYRFDGPVLRKGPAASHSPTPLWVSSRLQGAPQVLNRIIGRDDAVDAISNHLMRSRLVSIVGPGGIGKTTVGVAVAARLEGSFHGMVAFVDLAPVASPHLVPSALATSLGIPVRSEDAVPAMVAFLAGQPSLIVIDSCEHLVGAVASLCERLLKGLPELSVLVTSREPLRADGECVVRLPALRTPDDSLVLSSRQALGYASIELFVERASMSSESFNLSDQWAATVVEICRRLDGNALAIEMAASRVAALGLKGVAAQLDNRFQLLKSARRGEVPRHQSLLMTLDWSHDLLPGAEQLALRRLGVFAGYFSLDQALAILVDDDLPQEDAVRSLANLVNKSLVTAQLERPAPRYRLLDTTRAYAQRQLAERGELDDMAGRHASHFLNALEGRQRHSPTEFRETKPSERDACIANARVALDWAFSSARGQFQLGVALTIASAPLWFEASLIDECGKRVRRALNSVQIGSRQEMQLLHALGIVLYSDGPGAQSKATWGRVLELAEQLGDADFRIRALWGLWITAVHGGCYREGLNLAQRLSNLAAENFDQTGIWVGDRLLGTSLHLLGQQPSAQVHFKRMFSHPLASTRTLQIERFQFDQSVLGHSFHARVLWLLGLPDQAMHEAVECVRAALEMRHALSLCYALGVAACPIALLTGNLDAAAKSIPMLLTQSAKHVLPVWNSVGRCFDGLLRVELGGTLEGLTQLELGAAELHADDWVLYHTTALLDLAAALAAAGRLAPAQAAIEQAMEQATRHEEGWCMPELLRIKGEIALLRGGPDSADDAERLFLESFELAGAQEALSWQLRAAMSLTSLKCKDSDSSVALNRLRRTFASFSEGFDTRDLLQASRLLDRA